MKRVIRVVAAWNSMRRSVASVRGFTLIETMIVLAVTGGLFVAIAATLSGRQNSAEFQHAIQNVQARIQQTIDQVSTGFYPNNNNFLCQKSGGMVKISLGSNKQGTNDACVFLGKVVQFDVQGSSPEQYQTYTIAGLRGATVGVNSPFVNANPTVVGVTGMYPQYSIANVLQYGLTTVWMHSQGNSGCTGFLCSIGAVGFMMEPGALDANNLNGYAMGGQQIDLIPLPGTGLGQTIPQAVGNIQTELNTSTLTTGAPIDPVGGVQICFASAGTNQSGLITIGSSGRQLLVKLDIKGNKVCA